MVRGDYIGVRLRAIDGHSTKYPFPQTHPYFSSEWREWDRRSPPGADDRHQDYSLEEQGCDQAYHFTHELDEPSCEWDESGLDGEPLTIGIGVVCEDSNCVVLASDMRMTYGSGIRTHDLSGKQWDLPLPFRGAAAAAGKMWCVQPYVDELYVQLKMLGERKAEEQRIEIEEVENAVNDTRHRIHWRICDWEMRRTYKFGLSEWQRGEVSGGKLDPLILTAGKELIKNTDFPAHMLLAGFIDDRLVWIRADRRNQLQTNVSPGIFVIGSGGAIHDAMNHLIFREQSAERGLPSSLLHVYEALKKARRDKTVGAAAHYFIAWRNSQRVERFPADSHLLKGWAKAYKDRTNTTSLDTKKLAELQVEMQLQTHKVRH